MHLECGVVIINVNNVRGRTANEQVPFNSKDMQRLVERFARALWIEKAVITPEPLEMAFTTRGQKCMLHIFQFLESKDTKYLSGVLEQIIPPMLSKLEREALFALALGMSKKYGWTKPNTEH